MKSFQFLAIVTLTILITLSCKEDITKPVVPIEISKEIEPGRRDYVWDETIIKSSMLGGHSLWLRSLSALTPTDIWATAWADTSAERIWHYDGTNWKSPKIPSDMTTIRQIWAQNPNSVWACMHNGVFFQYDGKEWNRHSHVLIEEHDYFRVQRMWGRDDNEIYAIGNCYNYNEYPESEGYGVLIKYDGKEWKQIEIPKVYELFTRIRKDKNSILYILGWGYNTGIDKLYSYDGKSFKEIMSSSTGIYLGDITTDIIAINNQKAYKLINGEAIRWLDFKGKGFNNDVFGGRSEKDFFGNVYGVLHYNGTDFQNIYYNNNNSYLIEMAIFEKDVFFVFEDNRNTKILHGKLK